MCVYVCVVRAGMSNSPPIPVCPSFAEVVGASNMFFAFRWILLNFKREFTYDDAMKMWEVIWCDTLSTDHALFVALGIIGKEKEALLQAEDQSAILKVCSFCMCLCVRACMCTFACTIPMHCMTPPSPSPHPPAGQ